MIIITGGIGMGLPILGGQLFHAMTQHSPKKQAPLIQLIFSCVMIIFD